MAGRPGSRREQDVPHVSWQQAAPSRGRSESRADSNAQPSRPGAPRQFKTRSQLRAEERAAQRTQARSGRRAAGPPSGEPPPAQEPPPPSREPPPPSAVRPDELKRDEHPRRPHRPRPFTLLLYLAATVPLAWAVACFVDTGQPAVAALTAVAPLLSVVAMPVLALAVAGRRVIPAVACVAAAIVPWALVTGSAVAGPGPTSGTNRHLLRVMTVDGAAGRASAPTIVRATRRFGVDAVVVTGLSSGLAHDLTLAGITSLVQPRWVSIPAGSTVGAGLWTRQPISKATPVPGVRSPSASTQLTTAAGPISVVVAHSGGPALVPRRGWRADLRALGAAAPTGPRVLLGDVGATPWHPAFRALRSDGWYEAADVLGRGLRPTWPAWGPVPFSPLDQVMVGGGLGVSRADTITIPGTSHRALLVTIVLPDSGDGTADSAGE